MTDRTGRLFDGVSLAEWLRDRRARCEEELAQVPLERVVSEPLNDVSTEILSRYQVEPITIRALDRYSGEAREASVWGGPALVTAPIRSHVGHGAPGYAVTVHVPFIGTSQLLWLSAPEQRGLTPEARLMVGAGVPNRMAP